LLQNEDIRSVRTLSNLVRSLNLLHETQRFAEAEGWVTEATTGGYKVEGLSQFVSLGSLVKIMSVNNTVMAEVVRIDIKTALVRPFTSQRDIKLSTKVIAAGEFRIYPCNSWKGRTIDALANAIDDGETLPLGENSFAVQASPPNAMARKLIKYPVKTGVKVLDIFTPICSGQRIGIFSGSGVGKSTILSMLGSASGFDTVVTVLVGERGREVREFAESTLGKDRDRLISVVSTSDESPLMRRLAPQTGMRIAEYFRSCCWRGSRRSRLSAKCVHTAPPIVRACWPWSGGNRLDNRHVLRIG
jgi:flagellum-specific ATP synthase